MPEMLPGDPLSAKPLKYVYPAVSWRRWGTHTADHVHVACEVHADNLYRNLTSLVCTP